MMTAESIVSKRPVTRINVRHCVSQQLFPPFCFGSGFGWKNSDAVFFTDGKVPDCIEVLEKLLRHHPNHVKGLQLYGDVMLNKVKDIPAAKR